MRIGAIDQGTTSTRILVIDGDRQHLAARRGHAVHHPRPGWVEHDALELLGNIRACIAAAGPLDVLGLANQGESCLAWDAQTGEPLSPVIVWQDSRTAADLAALPADAAARVAARANLPLDPYFSAAKLGWLLRHMPAVSAAYAACRLHLGTTDAFFLDRLAGCFATDRATASRTSLMNMSTGDWDPELCAIFGVPIECLPPIRANDAGFGAIDGIPVRASIVDQQAALYGHGCRAPGDIKITFGTGAFTLGLTEAPVPLAAAHGLLPTVAWDLGEGVRYALDGGVYDVGSAIDWAVRAGLASGVEEFAEFEAPPAIGRGLVFVPAFSGLAAPHWDRTAVPLLLGIAPDTTRRDLCQALLEGIALSAASVLEAMDAVVPLRGAISIDGGVSNSPYFAQILADCLQREIRVSPLSEMTALGVAMLAAGEPLATPAAGSPRVFAPRPGADGWRSTFAEAVGRARNWRTP